MDFGRPMRGSVGDGLRTTMFAVHSPEDEIEGLMEEPIFEEGGSGGDFVGQGVAQAVAGDRGR